jgi:hypothetical protein
MIQTRVENQPATKKKIYRILMAVECCALLHPRPREKRNCIHLHACPEIFHQFIGETQKAIKIQIEAFRRSMRGHKVLNLASLHFGNVIHMLQHHTVIFLTASRPLSSK